MKRSKWPVHTCVHLYCRIIHMCPPYCRIIHVCPPYCRIIHLCPSYCRIIHVCPPYCRIRPRHMHIAPRIIAPKTVMKVCVHLTAESYTCVHLTAESYTCVHLTAESIIPVVTMQREVKPPSSSPPWTSVWPRREYYLPGPNTALNKQV